MILQCRKCLKLTTELEAMSRVFNTGMCVCGGNLSQRPMDEQRPNNMTHTREDF